MQWPFPRPSPSLPPSSSILPSSLISSQLHRKILIHFTNDGLILTPSPMTKGSMAVRIGWSEGGLEVVDDWFEELEGEEEGLSGEFLGVVGVLKGFQNSFLVLITEASLAASLFDDNKTIFAVESLLSIPLEKGLAKTVLKEFSAKQQAAKSKATPTTDDEDGNSTSTETETDGEEREEGLRASVISLSPEAEDSPPPQRPPIDSQATIKPSSKPFWRKSPFKIPSTTSAPPVTSIAPPNLLTPPLVSTATFPAPATTKPFPSTSIEKEVLETIVIDQETLRSQTELDSKILKELSRELKGMYFSKEIDVTRSFESKWKLSNASGGGGAVEGKGVFIEPFTQIPLWRRADKRFWWNHHLMRGFIEAGLHPYILVLQQGFVRETTISLPSSLPLPTSSPSTLKLLIISRRSIERPGLRYQRRGINQSGGVANFVETEFLVGFTSAEGGWHGMSFIQTRGSIPLFWSQSPWALKPPPILERTVEESQRALEKHFEKQKKIYGRVDVVNLAEAGGKEGVVVDAYRRGVERMREDGKGEGVKYVYFDFHHECRGMKYENISKLIETLKHDLDEMGTFWATEEQIFSTQTGVLRTNCIDCLDRTNVVQSAIAKYILNKHLVNIGVSIQDQELVHDQLDISFNGLWADNGDAISREYAGTSALKGDFTRTGKRNIRGALNDASNSVARLLQSTVSDFFKQATIDFVLGHNLNVFSEFQARLETSDPGEILRLAQIRLEAIETSFKSVLLENEERIAGWTLLSPESRDEVKPSTTSTTGVGGKFVEKVLLLSNKAIYVISYEYTLQKVTAFTRIPTGDITGIRKGAYILSTLSSVGRDPVENYGFVLSFHAGSTTERVRTYSMRVKTPSRPKSQVRSVSTSSVASAAESFSSIPPPEDDIHFFAFKALKPDMVRSGEGNNQSFIIDSSGRKSKTARVITDSIVGRLREECEKVGAVDSGDESWVQEKDIISVAEADAETSVLQKLGHRIQSFIWL